MDVKKLEADLEAIFDDYPEVQILLQNRNNSSFTITVRNTRRASRYVLKTFVKLLHEYGFQTYGMEVKNRFTDEIKHCFNTLTIDEAIDYRPRFWEQTVWVASHFRKD